MNNHKMDLLEQQMTVLQKEFAEVRQQLDVVSRTLGVSMAVLLKRIQLLEGQDTTEIDKLTTEMQEKK